MDSSNQTPVPVYEFDDMHMQPFDYRPDEAKDLDPRIGPQTREAPPYTMPPGNRMHIIAITIVIASIERKLYVFFSNSTSKMNRINSFVVGLTHMNQN